MNDEARAIVEALGLAPHPEGGLFRETFRAPLIVAAPQGPRSASTAIYFLLPTGGFSAFHRVRSDEVWHHYDGDPIDLHTLDALAGHDVVRLGRSLRDGERPQHVVRGGIWQAAVCVGDRFSLAGCTVAPGFDFGDFELPSREELIALFPDERAILERFVRG